MLSELKELRNKLRARQAATNADIFRYSRSGQAAAKYRAQGDSIGVDACLELLTALIEKLEAENGSN